MRKFISLLLALTLIFSMSACLNEQEENIPKIHFSQSIDELQQYDGQTVTLNGFMSLLSPLDGSLIYLMNIPFQSCPFCIPNTTTLSNTIAVEGSNIEFTTMPVKITGTLVFGDFIDGYGYEYSYKIENAQIIELDENEISEKTKVYYTVAQNDYIVDLFLTIDYNWQFAYYEEMEFDPAYISSSGGIQFERYSEIKSALEKLNANGEYDSFLSLLNKTEDLRIRLNSEISNDNVSALQNYKEEADAIYDEFYLFINEYEL